MTQAIYECNARIVVSDIDDTLAPPFKPVPSETLRLIERLIEDGGYFFLSTGQGIENVRTRVLDLLSESARKSVLVSVCNGAEVYSFGDRGELERVFLAWETDELTRFSVEIAGLIEVIKKEFDFDLIYCSSPEEFHSSIRSNLFYPVMVDDRESQVTIEFLSQPEEFSRGSECVEVLRQRVFDFCCEYLRIEGLPYEAILGGTTAIDFQKKGTNKGLPISKLFAKCENLHFSKSGVKYESADQIEVWGDSFSIDPLGGDCALNLALPDSKCISFRKFQQSHKYAPGVVEWQGEYELSEGLYEYLDGKVAHRRL
ncbi:HAD hydrolase family protein [Gilvimarinus sp. SDUM040013]|uniref:HAD hydrolase family protein n=1 Tax=Gilvimarinus gilvus TaxID=3058038 RepID=A0ABU4S351_9GAMM|nr:HAD hydrolase family protein [Gilvimarinus sp. SDUM040013]MDO3387178.1 HAD hydrolase family protein [Gilvimarinus sp. SDUM040013]MDX6851435.1 HAD hydrolase family protein [Gilvimarinus sp. SDUM040013]